MVYCAAMILECPECHKRFLVADALLMPAGRTVRCSACSHSWHADAPSAAATPSFADAVEIEMAPSGDMPEPAAAVKVADPVKKTRKPLNIPVRPFKMAAPALAALWLILAYLTYTPHFGRAALEGVEFSDVRMEPKMEGEKTSFVISGGIVNHSADAHQIPSVRVTLLTAEGNTIWEREYPVNKPLKAGDVYPFKIANADTARGMDVATVQLDMGNAAQLRAR